MTASRLLVVGTQAWNPADRTLGREHIRSLQVLSDGGPVQLAGFDSFGPHGVRDVVVIDDRRALLSSGYHLVLIDLVDGTSHPWELGPVSDIHELTRTGDRILLANTRHDELIELDLTGAISARRGLEGLRHEHAQPISHQRRFGGWFRRRADDQPTDDDHFHLNQGFVDLDGRDAVLVHHTTGFRPMQHARRRLVGHGTGGVIVLGGVHGDAKVHDLGLRAPHSVRRLDDDHLMILDSGRSELAVFDREWQETRRVPTPGWGRGAVIDDAEGVVHLAISATRARYRDSAQDNGVNRVVQLDLATWQERGRVTIDGVEQLWSLSLVTPEMAERLATWTG